MTVGSNTNRFRFPTRVTHRHGVFAHPAPPFVFGTGLDTNSTLTPTGSHRAHGRLAFQIVKERCSSRRWPLCPRNQGRTLLRNRNRQVFQNSVGSWQLAVTAPCEPHHSTRHHCQPSTRVRSQVTGVRLVQPWWSRTGSNRRPPACKAGALPIELRPRVSMGRLTTVD